MKHWHCSRCGKESTTDDKVLSHFHLCEAQPRSQVNPMLDETAAAQRLEWARRLLGADIVSHLDEEEE